MSCSGNITHATTVDAACRTCGATDVSSLVTRQQMMDRQGMMASNELSTERLAEWTANADAIFSFVKVPVA